MVDRPRARGGLSDYTPEIAAEICERIAMGEPLAVICRDDHMPAYRTAFEWRKAYPDFAADFARAREDGWDAIAERARLTARGVNSDNGGDSMHDIHRDKLIIETDLKLLAKWNPSKYGDRVEVGGRVDGSLTINIKRFDAID